MLSPGEFDRFDDDIVQIKTVIAFTYTVLSATFSILYWDQRHKSTRVEDRSQSFLILIHVFALVCDCILIVTYPLALLRSLAVWYMSQIPGDVKWKECAVDAHTLEMIRESFKI